MCSVSNNRANQPRLLLHACCGPCSLEPTRILQERRFEPAIFYANSNIAPADEYERRRETLQAWAGSEGIDVFEGIYDSAAWEATAGRIGDAALAEAEEHEPEGDQVQREAILRVDPEKRRARCRACYRLRLEEAARFAFENGYEALGTTLTVSIYQYVDVIAEELERACAPYGLNVCFDDFRPQFDEAERRSKELGMYRQNYCGCRFSDLEAQAERAERKAARKAAKAALRAAHAEEIAAAEAEQRARRNEKNAYAEKQRQKRTILKAMRNAQQAESE